MEATDVPQPGAGQAAAAAGAVVEPVYNNGAANPAVPAPTPAPTPVATPPAATPSYQSGGVTGKKFFDGISLMDVIVGSFVIAGLGLAVWYYRERIKHAKVEYPELRTDIETIKKEVDDLKTPTESPSTFG